MNFRWTGRRHWQTMMRAPEGRPAATPQGIDTGRAQRQGRVARLVDDSEELLAWGYTLTQAAERLGVSPNSLEQARPRRGLRLSQRSTPAACGHKPAAASAAGTRRTGSRGRPLNLEAGQ
jgi:hypothetical protein